MRLGEAQVGLRTDRSETGGARRGYRDDRASKCSIQAAFRCRQPATSIALTLATYMPACAGFEEHREHGTAAAEGGWSNSSFAVYKIP